MAKPLTSGNWAVFLHELHDFLRSAARTWTRRWPPTSDSTPPSTGSTSRWSCSPNTSTSPHLRISRRTEVIEKLQAHYGFERMPFGRNLAPGMLHEAAARAAVSEVVGD